MRLFIKSYFPQNYAECLKVADLACGHIIERITVQGNTHESIESAVAVGRYDLNWDNNGPLTFIVTRKELDKRLQEFK